MSKAGGEDLHLWKERTARIEKGQRLSLMDCMQRSRIRSAFEVSDRIPFVFIFLWRTVCAGSFNKTAPLAEECERMGYTSEVKSRIILNCYDFVRINL